MLSHNLTNCYEQKLCLDIVLYPHTWFLQLLHIMKDITEEEGKLPDSARVWKKP